MKQYRTVDNMVHFLVKYKLPSIFSFQFCVTSFGQWTDLQYIFVNHKSILTQTRLVGSFTKVNSCLMLI